MRNENSAYGSISLTLGIISLTLEILSIREDILLIYIMGDTFIFVTPIITIIYGIVGLAKDHRVPMAIIGLICGIVFVIIMIARNIRYFFPL